MQDLPILIVEPVGLCGQFHVSATLPSGQEPMVPVNGVLGGTHNRSWRFGYRQAFFSWANKATNTRTCNASPINYTDHCLLACIHIHKQSAYFNNQLTLRQVKPVSGYVTNSCIII